MPEIPVPKPLGCYCSHCLLLGPGGSNSNTQLLAKFVRCFIPATPTSARRPFPTPGSGGQGAAPCTPFVRVSPHMHTLGPTTPTLLGTRPRTTPAAHMFPRRRPLGAERLHSPQGAPLAPWASAPRRRPRPYPSRRPISAAARADPAHRGEPQMAIGLPGRSVPHTWGGGGGVNEVEAIPPPPRLPPQPRAACPPGASSSSRPPAGCWLHPLPPG